MCYIGYIESMTVIAEIPYKSGVVTVADSRYTIEEHYFWIKYDDDAEKTFTSYDKDLVIATAGDEALGRTVAEYLLLNEDKLKRYCYTDDSSLRKSLIDKFNKLALDCIGSNNSGFYISVRLKDGSIRTMLLDIIGPSDRSGSPDTKFYDLKEGAAMGIDGTVEPYLNALTAKYAPDKGKRDAADAMAIAFLLEDKYSEENYPIRYHFQYLYGVGGPIVAHVTDKDASADMVIERDERKRLEQKSYEELKRYFSEKIELERRDRRGMLRGGSPVAGKHNGREVSRG